MCPVPMQVGRAPAVARWSARRQLEGSHFLLPCAPLVDSAGREAASGSESLRAVDAVSRARSGRDQSRTRDRRVL